ncbi:MAG: flavodoxin family protein [Candidatus Aenigmatarchaeota archaeon]
MTEEISVVYYSRTGNTKKVAGLIASELGCDTFRIHDKKDRSGFLGYLKGGWDAWRENRTEITLKEEIDLSEDRLLCLGTPVWASNPTPAVRTFLAERKERLEKVAFFCTLGGTGDEKTFQELGNISGKTPLTTLAVREKEIESGTYKERVKAFAERLLE